MRIFTLFIGTAHTEARNVIVEIVGRQFESFTIITGTGCFRGETEPAWLVKLATDDVDKVIQTAAAIRQALHQDGVGIEHAGQYYRCTATDAASELLLAVNREV